MSLLKTSRASGVCTITLNRPAQRNALNRELLRGLHLALEREAKSGKTRVIVLRGSGETAFCAGADMHEVISVNAAEGRRSYFRDIAELLALIQRLPMPVIAQVSGFALAGGCGLAAACDLVVAGEGAVFGLPEVRVGMAAMVVMAPIERLIGRRRLQWMLLTGQTISAREAESYGLVSKVVSDDKVEETTRSLARHLASLPPGALSRAKEALLCVSDEPYGRESLLRLADRSALISLEHEATAAMKSFTSRSNPKKRRSV
jgi:enoyl-CoA hydratase/carnithine racemase